MKIAILADPLDNQYGGIHVYLKELLRALAANINRKHEYILIRTHKKNDFSQFRQVILSTYPIPGYLAFRLFFIIPWVCRKLEVDAVFEPAHFGPFNLPPDIKRITFIHDLTPILFPQFHNWQSAFLQKLFLPYIVKRANLIITNSEHTKNDVEAIYPLAHGKTKRIYLGYSSNFRPKIDKNVLNKYNIKQPYFLYVGTIEPRKNLRLLLKSFKDFKDTTNSIHQLVIVGKKGWKSKVFFKELKLHPYKKDIILCGYVNMEELPVFYTMCQQFIYPSIYEGFGLPVVEARACGASCIVAKNSSLVEVGGKTVSYFITQEELVSLLIENDTKLAKQDNNISSIFSWEQHQLLFEKLLETL